MWYDRVGRGLVAFGVAIAGSLGAFLLVKAAIDHAEIGFMTMVVAEGPPVQVLLLAILCGYVLLLVQMLRDRTAALGCGGLFGLLLAVAGFGLVLDGAGAGGTDFDVALFLAMAVAGLALAVGALFRLVARRVAPPAKPSDP